MTTHQDEIHQDLVGLTWMTQARTITHGEAQILVSMSWARGPIHTDAELARSTGLASITLPGPIVIAIMTGLWASSDLISELQQRHRTNLLAVVGTEARYQVPVSAGDTISLTLEIAAARASSKRPHGGVLTLRQVATNQRREEVAVVHDKVLFERLP